MNIAELKEKKISELARMAKEFNIEGAAGMRKQELMFALLQRPEVERVMLLNRTVARAESLAQDLDTRGAVRVAALDSDGCSLVREAGLLINTTSVGMHPDVGSSPLPRDDVLEYSFVLRPLAEIAPEVVHPVTGRTMRDHWQECDAGRHPLVLEDVIL